MTTDANNPSFTLNVGSLRSRLGFIAKAITNASIQPILSALQIEFSAQTVKIASYNLDACIQISLDPENVVVPITGPKSYTMCPPARLLAEILSKLPGEADICLTLKSETDQLIAIDCGGFVCTIKGFDPVEFPQLPSVPTEEATLTRTLSLGDMRSGLEKVLYAVATEETKQILTGIYCEFFTNALRLTATDGHRIAQVANVGIGEQSSMGEPVYTTILSKAVLDLLVAMPGADDVQLLIKLDERRAEFCARQTTASANLLVGQYPPVEKLLRPDGNPWKTSIRVERVQFLSAVERCLIVANATENRVVILDIKASKLVLYANAEAAKMHEKLSCRLTMGKEQRVAFNCKYLFSALKTAQSEIVDIVLKADNSMGKILAVDDPTHEQLIAQIQIRGGEEDKRIDPEPPPVEEPEEPEAEVVNLLDLEDKPITPAISTYISFKKQYPEHLVLLRLGDFYEAFGTDAQNFAQATELVLTSKLIAGLRLPMGGMPHHSLERFLPMITKAGYRAVVIDAGGATRFVEPETAEPETPEPEAAEPETPEPEAAEPETPDLDDKDSRSYQILTTVPPSDANFKACIKEASIPALEAALNFALSLPDGQKTRIKQLQTQLKKLSK